jgi:hypothetical protein
MYPQNQIFDATREGYETLCRACRTFGSAICAECKKAARQFNPRNATLGLVLLGLAEGGIIGHGGDAPGGDNTVPAVVVSMTSSGSSVANVQFYSYDGANLNTGDEVTATAPSRETAKLAVDSVPGRDKRA